MGHLKGAMDERKDGLSIVIVGLIDAAEKASYSVALGAGALGACLWGLGGLGATGTPLTLMSISAFFIFAKFGRYLDAIEQRHQRQFSRKNKNLSLEGQPASEQKEIGGSLQGYEEEESALYVWRAPIILEKFILSIAREESLQKRIYMVDRLETSLQRIRKQL